MTKGSSSDWYANLLASIGEHADVYNHASRVSTFASLFALGMDHAHPEDLAMAGIFHDLGMVEIPEAIINKSDKERTLEENVLYYSHPEKTLLNLKSKRISLPPEVEKAILQHHEKISGKGFPKGLSDRITLDAQILSYADQFDYFTSITPGNIALSPYEAHQKIIRTQSIGMDILSIIGRLLSSQKKK